MQQLLKAIEKNPNNTKCISANTPQTDEIRRLTSNELVWGGRAVVLNPARLTTAWLIAEDPLMLIAGPGYRATEVRDKSFLLQEEALSNLRGNRKLTKAKMGDALSSLKPTEDQTKVIARILLALKQYQTVCYDPVGKTVWTMPEDLRAWSKSLRTIWIDAKSETMLDFNSPPSLGTWLSERERDGWKIDWPVSEDSYEDMKRIALEQGISIPVPEGKKRPVKDDYTKVLGRYYAIRHLTID